MKISEMNRHQKLAYEIMDEITSEYIGGYENSMSDYEEDTDEYKVAEKFLAQGHEVLKDFIYAMVMSDIENSRNGQYKDAKFAGTEFIMERIETRLVKWGY